MESGSLKSGNVSILITRQRARALAGQIEAQEATASGGLPESPNTPGAPSPPRERKTLFKSLRSLRRPVNTSQAEAQEPVAIPQSVIPTPSEGSELSFCIGSHSDSESEDNYEEVISNAGNVTERSYENAEQTSELHEPDPESKQSSLGSVGEFSLVLSEEMNDQVSQLCDAVRTALNSQPSGTASKLSVPFPVFRGEECEDVQEFVSNYKRAARLNRWSGSSLALGLPLYIKGHASAWFKTLEAPDEMSFDDLSAALIHHFASGASEWRVRQALGQRRQLEKESVADYSYSLRTQCTRLSLPRSEWTHYFVQGLKPEIREYVILQQPDNLESAENYAKLKESVLSTSDKTPTFDAKQMSDRIIQEINKAAASKETQVNALSQQGVEKSDIKRMIRAEVQQLMGTPSNNTNAFRSRPAQSFPTRGFRTRTGDPVCFNCGRRGHTYYNCRANPDPRVPRYNRGRQNNYSRQQQGQSNFSWNSKQGN